MPKRGDAADGPGFEDALRELEGTVDALERGELDLARAMADYGRGVELLARCHALLDGAERSVAVLTGVDADGRPLSAPLEPAAGVEHRTPAP